MEEDAYLAALSDLYENPDKLRALRDEVDRRRDRFDWRNAVREIVHKIDQTA